jgi:hypothetical protein
MMSVTLLRIASARTVSAARTDRAKCGRNADYHGAESERSVESVGTIVVLILFILCIKTSPWPQRHKRQLNCPKR